MKTSANCGMNKSRMAIFNRKPPISLKRCKIWQTVLLFT